MPFLWLSIEDEAGSGSLRGYIERHSIALLSNYRAPAVDAASQAWLGRYCNRERVRQSGLWNQNHVAESYEPSFLDRFEQLIAATGHTQ